MPCVCAKLSRIMDLSRSDSYANDFQQMKMPVVEAAEWKKLFRCDSCGQHWIVDNWDKLQSQFTIKIDDPTRWKEFDRTQLVKEYRVELHGGVSGEECMWAGCPKRAL